MVIGRVELLNSVQLRVEEAVEIESITVIFGYLLWIVKHGGMSCGVCVWITAFIHRFGGTVRVVYV
jgi:hypothetical protein